MTSEREWINSGIQIAWVSRRTPADLPEAFDEAWDELQEDPEWRTWMLENEEALKGEEVFNYLEVGDDESVKVSHRRGNLKYVVPITYFENEDVRERARALIHDLYAARAERAKVEPPPPV